MFHLGQDFREYPTPWCKNTVMQINILMIQRLNVSRPNLNK